MGQVQRDSIAHDQSVIEHGGRIAKAEPRAFGKTSRTCGGSMWGVFTGRRRMVPVFSANMEKSKNQVMARWKAELLANDLLFWMYPELIWPLRALENKPQRCASQTMRGEPTWTKWTADRIVFPHLPGVPGSGAALIALPLKSCRGATHTTADGTILRPELCIFDDVQKDEDAGNPNTVAKLEELIDHTAMMLGGHSQTMSAIMSCTVRQPDDLSEQYLKKPGWRRVRYKMLVSRSETEKEHWLGRYAEIRLAYDPESPEDQIRAHKESLAYYVENREEMDRGAVVTWDWAYAWNDADPTEISATQHAYNILIDLGESVFASECQNEPLRETGGLEILTAEQIMRKQSGYGKGEFPAECSVIVSKIDVHPEILYWEVWAVDPRFTGYCIDYGTFPDQKRRTFPHASPPRKLSKLFPGRDAEARIYAALKSLNEGCEEESWDGLLKTQWTRKDGVPMRIVRQHIDASGQAKLAVVRYIEQSEHAAVMTPAYGKGITATAKPLSQWRQSMEQRNVGPEWFFTKGAAGEPQGVFFDTNYWKTRFHRGLSLPEQSAGGLYLYKADPEQHRRIAAHWSSEKAREKSVGTRIVYEFYLPPGHDNHDLDVGVGCLVAASQAGITNVARVVKKRQRMSLEEMARRARGKAG